MRSPVASAVFAAAGRVSSAQCSLFTWSPCKPNVIDRHSLSFLQAGGAVAAGLLQRPWRRLFRRELPNRHLVDRTQGDSLLNVARVQCRFGDPQARVAQHTYGAEFRCIEPRVGLRQCARNRPMYGGFVGSAVTQAAVSRMEPHKLPSSIAYCTIQVRRGHILGQHPRRIERGLLQSKAAGKNGADANKDCRRPDHEGLPALPTFAGIPAESPVPAFGTASGVIAASELTLISSSLTTLSRSVLATAEAASDGAGANGKIEVLPVRVDRWSFTSDFLMRLTEGLQSTGCVPERCSSERCAVAGGEKGKSELPLQYTPKASSTRGNRPMYSLLAAQARAAL